MDVELYCTDGEDDDTNGLIDCADPSCWDSLTCLFEHDCSNEIDDDDDGAVDCADDDCAQHVDCYVESNCEDGIDDEEDGLTDCEDDDCEFTPTCGAACEEFVTVGCGDVLEAQDPLTGTNTFSGFPCSVANPDTPTTEDYVGKHLVYNVQADEGCSALVQVKPNEDFSQLDIYAMGPGCAAEHCIKNEGLTDCSNPTTPSSALFGEDACVKIPANYASSAWVAVIPNNETLGYFNAEEEEDKETSLFEHSYELEVICDCQ